MSGERKVSEFPIVDYQSDDGVKQDKGEPGFLELSASGSDIMSDIGLISSPSSESTEDVVKNNSSIYITEVVSEQIDSSDESLSDQENGEYCLESKKGEKQTDKVPKATLLSCEPDPYQKLSPIMEEADEDLVSVVSGGSFTTLTDASDVKQDDSSDTCSFQSEAMDRALSRDSDCSDPLAVLETYVESYASSVSSRAPSVQSCRSSDPLSILETFDSERDSITSEGGPWMSLSQRSSDPLSILDALESARESFNSLEESYFSNVEQLKEYYDHIKARRCKDKSSAKNEDKAKQANNSTFTDPPFPLSPSVTPETPCTDSDPLEALETLSDTRAQSVISSVRDSDPLAVLETLDDYPLQSWEDYAQLLKKNSDSKKLRTASPTFTSTTADSDSSSRHSVNSLSTIGDSDPLKALELSVDTRVDSWIDSTQHCNGFDSLKQDNCHAIKNEQDLRQLNDDIESFTQTEIKTVTSEPDYNERGKQKPKTLKCRLDLSRKKKKPLESEPSASPFCCISPSTNECKGETYDKVMPSGKQSENNTNLGDFHEDIAGTDAKETSTSETTDGMKSQPEPQIQKESEDPASTESIVQLLDDIMVTCRNVAPQCEVSSNSWKFRKNKGMEDGDPEGPADHNTGTLSSTSSGKLVEKTGSLSSTSSIKTVVEMHAANESKPMYNSREEIEAVLDSLTTATELPRHSMTPPPLPSVPIHKRPKFFTPPASPTSSYKAYHFPSPPISPLPKRKAMPPLSPKKLPLGPSAFTFSKKPPSPPQSPASKKPPSPPTVISNVQRVPPLSLGRQSSTESDEGSKPSGSTETDRFRKPPYQLEKSQHMFKRSDSEVSSQSDDLDNTCDTVIWKPLENEIQMSYIKDQAEPGTGKLASVFEEAKPVIISNIKTDIPSQSYQGVVSEIAESKVDDTVLSAEEEKLRKMLEKGARDSYDVSSLDFMSSDEIVLLFDAKDSKTSDEGSSVQALTATSPSIPEHRSDNIKSFLSDPEMLSRQPSSSVEEVSMFKSSPTLGELNYRQQEQPPRSLWQTYYPSQEKGKHYHSYLYRRAMTDNAQLKSPHVLPRAKSVEDRPLTWHENIVKRRANRSDEWLTDVSDIDSSTSDLVDSRGTLWKNKNSGDRLPFWHNPHRDVPAHDTQLSEPRYAYKHFGQQTKSNRQGFHLDESVGDWSKTSEGVQCEPFDVNSAAAKVKQHLQDTIAWLEASMEKSNNTCGAFQELCQELEKYHISKQGDVATLKSLEVRSRPMSSDADLFRDKMYNEFMNKVQERMERKEKKVIKISKPSKEIQMQNRASQELYMVDEFMEKVKRRKERCGHDDDNSEINERNDTPKNEYQLEGGGGTLAERVKRDVQLLLSSKEEQGVWSPGGAPSQAVEEASSSSPAQQELPTPPVWQPPHSPTTERKQFRPLHVSFISKNKGEQKKESSLKPDVCPEESFAWKSEEKKQEAKEKITDKKTGHSLPSPQSPTVTLLQKARAGELSRGAVYIDHKMNETEMLPIPTPEYTVKSEHESEDEEGRKIIKLSPKKYEGIGPTTRYGLPLGLRSVVKEENQGEWYKKMYNSLHRSVNQGGSGSGYMSEPEPELHSEYNRYATLDRRRLRNRHNVYEPAAARYETDLYKNEPRSIEEYEPGKSSLAEHESKKWWEELQTTFDSFDSWLEKRQLAQKNDRIGVRIKYGTRHNPPLQKTPLHYSGYESDSTLVYRKREEQKNVQPEEQKAWYLNIQKGGEVPLSGLRKPAPEKPEAPTHEYIEDSVNIHYRSPCRRLAKEEIPEDELRMRQERHMRQLYEEQRRRKLIQELDDMDRRRHTDNLLPKQKSPIPLNRYDDLFDEPPKIKLKDRTPEPKVCARALYSFLPQNARELGFTKGDIIFIRRQLDKNWYEGEHNAMIGIFPVSYVEIIPYDGIRTMPRKPTHGQGRAKFTFIAQSPAELSLVKGESILLTRRVDENWYEGRIGNRTGIFPVSYVEVISEPTPKSSTIKPVGTPVAHSLIMNGSTPPQSGKQVAGLSVEVRGEPVRYRALYNYRPQNEDELELNEGDVVMVVEKCDDGWYVGTSDASGLFGTFPGNYVVRI